MQHLLIFATFLGVIESQDFLGGLSGLFGGGGGGGGSPFAGIFQQVAPALQNPAFQNVFAAAPQFFQQPQGGQFPQLFQSFMKPPAPAPQPAPSPVAPSGGPAPAPVPDASDYDQPIPIGKTAATPAPPPAPKPAPAPQGGGSNYDDIDYSLTGANPQG